MKKIIALSLVLALAFAMSGCGLFGFDSEDSGEVSVGEVTADSVLPTSSSAVTTEPPQPFVEIPFPGYTPSDHEMRAVSAWELVEEIQTGWNLGNTLDARGSGMSAENAWGNPTTTFTMIHAVAEAGFDSVRVPVSWGTHMGGAPDYLIHEEWLDRAERIVKYVLAAGMYCILNTHHEDWIVPDEANEEQNTEQLVAIWEQLSERFADYNEKLIFEGMNEPRTRGSAMEWRGGTPEERGVVNRMNAAFVETVRASGGNNAQRILMVPSYAASAEGPAMSDLADAFEEFWGGDNADDKIIASIHAYTPYNFALMERGAARWEEDTDGTQEIDWMFDRIKSNFLDKGIPVILGETGARDRGGNTEARAAWARYYFGKGRELGIPVYWWDNGVFEGEDHIEIFGILNRRQAEFAFPEIVDAIMGN